METVFVYGTLRKAESNHYMMDSAVYLGIDKIKANRCKVARTLPGIIEGDDEVVGELYHVSKIHLVALDRFEGCPTFYDRKEVTTAGGVRAWTYWPQPTYITK